MKNGAAFSIGILSGLLGTLAFQTLFSHKQEEQNFIGDEKNFKGGLLINSFRVGNLPLNVTADQVKAIFVNCDPTGTVSLIKNFDGKSTDATININNKECAKNKNNTIPAGMKRSITVTLNIPELSGRPKISQP